MVEKVGYYEFELVSPLGGRFRYFHDAKGYHREALNEQAHFTQYEDVKDISRSVYDHAYRVACGTQGVQK